MDHHFSMIVRYLFLTRLTAIMIAKMIHPNPCAKNQLLTVLHVLITYNFLAYYIGRQVLTDKLSIQQFKVFDI